MRWPRAVATPLADGQSSLGQTSRVTEGTGVERRAWIVLFLACMAGFVGGLDLSVVFVAFPEIEDAFPDASTALLSWVLTIYGIVVAALLVPGGRLADLYGRRRVFLIGATIFGLGALASGAAPSPEVLIATRAFQACGGALMTPSAMALVLRAFPEDRRAMAIGTWGAVGGVASAAGPSIGAFVVDLGGWRWCFWLSVPLAVVILVWGRAVLVESVDPEVEGLTDLVGSALVIVAVGSLALGLVEGPSWGWTSPAVLGAFVTSAVAGTLLWRRSLRHPSPVIAPDLFRLPLFRRANVVALLFGAAFFAMFFGMVRFLTEGWGYSTGKAGLLVTPGPMAAALFSYVGGRLADRVGHRAVMVPGALVFALGGTWLALGIGEEPELATVWFPGVVLLGIGIGLVFPNFQSAAVHGVPEARFGVAAAAIQTVVRLSGTLGIALAVVLVGGFVMGDPVADFDPLWWTLVGLGLVSAAASATLDTRPAPAPLVLPPDPPVSPV
jgi:EmrB/QacA subfamily drug resistance transporter